MKRLALNIAARQKSEIFIGKNLQAEVKKYLYAKDAFYITDTNLAPLLKKYLNPNTKRVLTMPVGEEYKTLTELTVALEFLLEGGASKNSVLVGFGGGVVTDLTGLAAAVYKRGMGSVLISTSLLGMVDAAIGGKNGVNFGEYKNMVGTISQPQAIFMDTGLLKTLPEQDFKSGLGEAVKTAIVLNRPLFRLLGRPNIAQNLEQIITACIGTKIKTVEEDPTEQRSKRWLLNFGHSLGHALESMSGFKLKHGIAVAIGCHFAAFVSWQKGMLSEAHYNRVVTLLQKLDLPLSANFDVKQAMQFIKKDKKRVDAKSINFVLIRGIGQGITTKMTFTELGRYLKLFAIRTI